ncbi:PCYCGC domain-containing protein [Bacillus toyonensis]|nr:PCYCGC domain-containing protein [Bacillus toyonensis]
MTDKKENEKQANCCQVSSSVPAKEETAKEISSCCSSKKVTPIVPVVKNTSCYCDCDENSDHKNNKDCFISEIKENCEVTWESHAMSQAVCVVLLSNPF